MSRKPAKPQLGNTTEPKRNNAPVPTRQVNPSFTDLKEQLARQARELEEAHNERVAIGDVLRIISSSPGELEAVFQAILTNEVRINGAKFGDLYLHRGRRLPHGEPQCSTRLC
jgi:hypothetical protein